MRLLGSPVLVRIALLAAVGVGGLLAYGTPSRPSAISRVDLTGRYDVRLPFGYSWLRLESDGHYTQEVEVAGERVSVNGKWSYAAADWLGDVTLQDCVFPTDGFGRLNEGWRRRFKGATVIPVKRRFIIGGALELAFDEGYSYTKRE
jgi:hypothetical protein